MARIKDSTAERTSVSPTLAGRDLSNTTVSTKAVSGCADTCEMLFAETAMPHSSAARAIRWPAFFTLRVVNILGFHSEFVLFNVCLGVWFRNGWVNVAFRSRCPLWPEFQPAKEAVDASGRRV